MKKKKCSRHTTRGADEAGSGEKGKQWRIVDIEQQGARGLDAGSRRGGSEQVPPRPQPQTTQTTNHKPQSTNHTPRSTKHKPQTTFHKPQTTNHVLPLPNLITSAATAHAHETMLQRQNLALPELIWSPQNEETGDRRLIALFSGTNLSTFGVKTISQPD